MTSQTELLKLNCILLYHASDLGTQQYFIHSAFPENVELNNVAQVLRFYADGNQPILVRPDDLSVEAGVDVEKLDVVLHLLERLGFVHRSFNFTLNANLLLNRSPDWLKERLSTGQSKLLDGLML